MEVVITIIIAILSGLAVVLYKKPEIAYNLLYKVFIGWSVVIFIVIFCFKMISLELEELIVNIETSDFNSPLDKMGNAKSIKLIGDKISSYKILYINSLASEFIMIVGLVGLYFFSKFMLSHQKKTDDGDS